MNGHQSEWVRSGEQLLRRSSITGAKWHDGVLYVYFVGADKFMSVRGRDAQALWDELKLGTLDLATGELAEGSGR